MKITPPKPETKKKSTAKKVAKKKVLEFKTKEDFALVHHSKIDTEYIQRRMVELKTETLRAYQLAKEDIEYLESLSAITGDEQANALLLICKHDLGETHSWIGSYEPLLISQISRMIGWLYCQAGIDWDAIKRQGAHEKLGGGKPKGAYSALRKAMIAVLTKNPNMTNDDLWMAIKSKPLKGHLLGSTAATGRYVEVTKNGKTTCSTWGSFKNTASKVRGRDLQKNQKS